MLHCGEMPVKHGRVHVCMECGVTIAPPSLRKITRRPKMNADPWVVGRKSYGKKAKRRAERRAGRMECDYEL